ncbi:MAG: 2-amino-4-hydroxy-6-hydroxymethyldihydropteridine diphosphokinase [Alphaproteobacteria bacterium]
MPNIMLAFGANLAGIAGTPAQTISAAISQLPSLGIEVQAIAAYKETAPWLPEGSPLCLYEQPNFVNSVVAASTQLPPRLLMARLLKLERSFGRKRSIANAPRTIDIDILDYGGEIHHGNPILPHPRMWQREFVTIPLLSIHPLYSNHLKPVVIV